MTCFALGLFCCFCAFCLARWGRADAVVVLVESPSSKFPQFPQSHVLAKDVLNLPQGHRRGHRGLETNRVLGHVVVLRCELQAQAHFSSLTHFSFLISAFIRTVEAPREPFFNLFYKLRVNQL